MAIENQEDLVTCCNGKTYTKSQIMYRLFMNFTILSLFTIFLFIECATVTGISNGQLVDIHVFICSMGGICILAVPTTMSPTNINEKRELSHGTQGFIGTIIISAGIAVVHGNSEHTYPCHSVAGYTCLIAIWIQFLLGTVIFEKNLTENDGIWWAKVVHTVLGLTTIITVALCFISGYDTLWFSDYYYFLSDPLTLFTGFSVSTAFVTLLILSLPFYKLTKKAIKRFRGRHNVSCP